VLPSVAAVVELIIQVQAVMAPQVHLDHTVQQAVGMGQIDKINTRVVLVELAQVGI
jgi:hypothetical protein